MQSGADLLKELESLLDHFYSPTSTNEQKQEIGGLLQNFAQQQGVWRYCLHFLQQSSNQFVLMYSLNLIENLATNMWLSLELTERAELRHFLMQHLLSHPSSTTPSPSASSPTPLPPFIRNKLIKVLVLIGRSDWPHHYPEFFSHILQLVRTPETVSLGLLFLQTASEELACPRSDLITSQRRDQLVMLMQQNVSTILTALMQILDSIVDKQLHSVTPTPPPSPNVSPIKQIVSGGTPQTPPTLLSQHTASSPFGTPTSASQGHTSHLLAASTPPKATPTPSLTLTPPKTTPTMARNAPYVPLDLQTEEVCSLALRCLAHLFSWMSLSSLITPSILDTIFHFANLGCDSGGDCTDNSGNLGSLAMDCVNELLVRNCVPREFEAFLMKLFENSFSLLQHLTGETERGISCNFSLLDDRFLAKCSDFFYWFVSSHLKRVEYNPNFPVLEFLSLFCKYTFKQPGVDSFCVCLDTWGVFLDHLIMMSSDTYGRHSPPSNNHYERYKGVLISMMESVLQKMQLHYNIDELREIDDDTVDDDNETEWQSFLRQSLEFVGKVAELFPSAAFQVILPLLESYSQVYFSLQRLITPGQLGKAGSLAIAEGSECEKLHAVLKDLASILQALGRLAEHFIDGFYESRLSEAQLLMKKFCMLANYSAKLQLFNVTTPIPEILDHDFIELYAQIFGTLQAYSHWLSQLYLSSLRQPDQPQLHELVVSLVTTIADSAIPLLSHEVPEKIALSACQLLLSVVNTVRPKFFLSLSSVQKLMDKATAETLEQLPTKAYVSVYRCLCLTLVLPWPETSDPAQQWSARSSKLTQLLSGATSSLHRLPPGWNQDSQLQERAKVLIKRKLILLEDLAACVAHERPKSKMLVYKSLSPSVEFAISLFPVYLQQADVLDLLIGFFLTLFDSLKSQAGPELAERTTQTFMALLTRERMEEALSQEASHGSKVVEKFLRVLKLLVQDPAGADKAFLPSVISFVMSQIHPLVKEQQNSDILLVLHELFYQLLLNNWRYFFLGSVLLHMDSDETTEPIEHEVEFFNIMEMFGNSFLRPDIALFKQNLSYLETLNTKHKLYSKVQFSSCMLYPFLQLLLQVLVQKSHDLLQEEICSSIYSMAAVNFAAYHQQFLPKFLTSIGGLSADQQKQLVLNYKVVEDLPSFVQNLRQFANDLRYFLILNQSVPAGTVKLS